MNSRFIPSHARLQPTRHEISQVVQFLQNKHVCVLTGAGLSTESGIPDYRSPQGSYSRGHKPLTHHEFSNHSDLRKRYWARAIVASKTFLAAKPSQGHIALSRLEAFGYISPGVITQNVDRLLQRAGLKNVLELHGNAKHVFCLSCGEESQRIAFQKRVFETNLEWFDEYMPINENDVDLRADGDAAIDATSFHSFKVPECMKCGGIIMPTIVFFGGAVPEVVREMSFEMIRKCDRLLVVGSSLTVLSSLRLVRAAVEGDKPAFIVNSGSTRADSIVNKKLDKVACGPLLMAVADELCT